MEHGHERVLKTRYTLKDSDVRELHAEGCTNIEIAEILGVSPSAIHRRMTNIGLRRNPTVRRDAKRYTVYNHRNSQYVTEGTLREIAKVLQIKDCSARNYLYRFRNGYDCPWEFYEAEGERWTN